MTQMEWFIAKFIDISQKLEQVSDSTEIVELMRQVILFVVRQCPEEAKWVNDKYIDICCLEK